MNHPQVLCQLALGGNVGDVDSHICDALTRIDQHPEISVIANSSHYQTTPVGASAGQLFTNAAATLKTSLPPEPLLEFLQRVEQELGRERVVHWGPRLIDLDVILYGNKILQSETLQIPHPACWYRRFVLDPLVEIAPDAMHPERGLSVCELQRRLIVRPLIMTLWTSDTIPHLTIRESLQMKFPKDQVKFQHNSNVSGATWNVVNANDHPEIWDSLSKESRLDVSLLSGDMEDALGYVIQSALDVPHII